MFQSGSPGCVDTLYVLPPRSKDALKQLKRQGVQKQGKKGVRLQAFFPVCYTRIFKDTNVHFIAHLLLRNIDNSLHVET